MDSSPPTGNPQDDLSPILSRWVFDGGHPQLRFLEGIEGIRRIQIRLEAGILQFEVTGRPDGTRPEGAESWLDFWIFRCESRSERPSVCDFETLHGEAILYHQRAAAFLILEDFASVVQDCQRNLRTVEFVQLRGMHLADQASFETIRLAAVLMRARAEAAACVKVRDTQGALAAIDRGLAGLRGDLSRAGQSQEIGGARGADAESIEATVLRSMRDALVPKLPSSQRVDLEVRLRRALQLERYELAAILRNELRQIGD
ncbi:MAG: hypothetical protein EXS15_01415 [Phycisphaerales bacterium]|nr:hypothetical protein [Phycisphaerales bacterium]